MNCVTCGKELKTSAKVCLACGTVVATPVVTPASVDSQKDMQASSSTIGHAASGDAAQPIVEIAATPLVQDLPKTPVFELPQRTVEAQFQGATEDIFIKKTTSGDTKSGQISHVDPANNARPKPNKALLLGIGVLVVVIVAGFILMNPAEEKKAIVGKSETSPTTNTDRASSGVSRAITKSDINALLQFASVDKWAEVEETLGQLSRISYPAGDAVTARRLNEDGLQSMKSGNFDQAINAFLNAVDTDKNSAEFRNNLGYAYLERGKLDLAATTLLDTLLVDPTRGICWLNVAHLFAKQNKDDAAVSAMKLAIYFARDKLRAINSLDKTLDGNVSHPLYSAYQQLKGQLTNIPSYLKN